MEQYSGGGQPRCGCCGEEEYVFLALDHVDGGGSRARSDPTFSRRRLFLQLIADGFPPGYAVLCHNCNWGKHALGVCPHAAAAEA